VQLQPKFGGQKKKRNNPHQSLSPLPANMRSIVIFFVALLVTFFILQTLAATAPAPVSKGAVSKGAVSKGAVSKGAVSKGAVSKGAVSKGAVSKGAVSKGAVSKGAVSKGAVSKGAVSKGAVSKGAVSKGAVSKGAVSKAAPPPAANTSYKKPLTAGYLPDQRPIPSTSMTDLCSAGVMKTVNAIPKRRLRHSACKVAGCRWNKEDGNCYPKWR